MQIRHRIHLSLLAAPFVVLAAALFLHATAARAQQQPTLVVLPLAVQTISGTDETGAEITRERVTAEAGALTERIHDAMTRTRTFTMTPMSRVTSVFKSEDVLSTIDDDFLTIANVVAGIPELQVDYIAVGYLNRRGQTYTLHLRLINVKIQHRIAEQTLTQEGSYKTLNVDQVVTGLVRVVNPEVNLIPTVSVSTPGTSASPPDTSHYTLVIRAFPQDATILVDGNKVASQQGRVSVPLAAGPHDVQVSRKGYDTSRQAVTLAKDETMTMRLKRQRFTLRVTPTPADATVFIDGRAAGKGEVSKEVTPGPHTVRVIRNGYKASQMTVQVTQNETRTVQLVASGGGGGKTALKVLLGLVLAGGGAVGLLVHGSPPPPPPSGGGGGGGGTPSVLSPEPPAPPQ